jgi:endonuclease/exonuclease/phosphatase family metal-dependent hydrolase
MGTLRSRLIAGAAVLGLLATTPAAYAHGGRGGPGHHGGDRAAKVTVMTRNLYLGADINRPVEAAMAVQAGGGSPQDVVVALANATHETRAIVDQTNFPVRARLLAREIDRTNPDLIGLQEVSLWRSGPLELTSVGVPNATTVDYDFLTILIDALAKRGERYEAVAVGNRADVEAPSFTGSPFTGTMSADARDIRLTMRDVILKRVGNKVRVTDSGDAIYAYNLSVDISGVAMKFDRGYQWVDVTAGRDSFRFVNTHLEAFSSDLAYAQAAELLGAAAPAGKDTIFVCDCNSDPLNNSVKPIDTVPHSAPYNLITSTGGFTDQWLEWAPAERGWTSGLSETVDDPTGAGFDHRIDMVFGRAADGSGFEVKKGAVTGTRRCDRDRRTGLWPSDHAGVVMTLVLGGIGDVGSP